MKLPPKRTTFLLLVMLLMLAVPAVLGGREALALLVRIPPVYFILFALLTLTKWTCMTWRWTLLLKTGIYRVRQHRIFAIVLASDFASETVPLAGAMGSNLLFFKQQSIPPTTTLAYSNFIFIMDLAAVFTVIVAALYTTLQETDRNITLIAVIGLSLIAIGMITIFLAIRHIEKLKKLASRTRLHCLIPTRYKDTITTSLISLENKLAQTGRLPLGTLLPLLLISLTIWSIRFSLLYLAIIAVGGDISWAYTAVAQFVSGLIGMITFLPGGFPGMDVSIAALLHGDLTMKTILAAIFLWRLVTYHVNFFAGGMAFLWLSSRPAEADESLPSSQENPE
jgi:uncharacterized protein (TIRG00374 family)